MPWWPRLPGPNYHRVLQGAPPRGRQLYFTFPSAPESRPFFQSVKSTLSHLKSCNPVEGIPSSTAWNLTSHGNFRPGATFSQNTFSGHATDFFIRRVVLGQESSILQNLQENWCEFVLLVLRPERPFTGVSGPSGPKIAKKSQKECFWGSAKKSPKIPEKVKKYPKLDFWGYFLTFSGIFGDFFADPQKHSFWDFFAILGPEGPETPVNGRSGRNSSVLLILLTVSIWSSGHLPRHCTGHLLMLIAWIKGWMAVTNLAHSRQKVDVCRFAWFSVRSLLCKSFWANSGDFQAETKMRRLLGKVGRVFVRVKTKQFSGKIQAIFSDMQISRQTRVVFGQKIECLGFLSNPCNFWSEIWICRYLGKIGDFLGEISAKSGIWMKCLYRLHDVRTTCFFQAVCSHDFRTFSHDFRTTCLFKVFLFARIFARFARCSHAGRRPACLCQIRSKFAQIWWNSVASIGAP